MHLFISFLLLKKQNTPKRIFCLLLFFLYKIVRNLQKTKILHKPKKCGHHIQTNGILFIFKNSTVTLGFKLKNMNIQILKSLK